MAAPTERSPPTIVADKSKLIPDQTNVNTASRRGRLGDPANSRRGSNLVCHVNPGNVPPSNARIQSSRVTFRKSPGGPPALLIKMSGFGAGEARLDLILRIASGPKQIEFGKKVLLRPSMR